MGIDRRARDRGCLLMGLLMNIGAGALQGGFWVRAWRISTSGQGRLGLAVRRPLDDARVAPTEERPAVTRPDRASALRRAALVATLWCAAAGLASGVGWRPGDRVLASPTQMDGSWQVCVVKEVPKGPYDGYQLNCAKDPARSETVMSVPAKWIKAVPAGDPAGASGANAGSPSPPAAKPAPDTAGGRASAAPAARPAAVAAGDYECWAFNTARMDLNFSITGEGRYRDAEGKSGRYTYDAASGRIAFQGGLLQSAMPEGFYSIYSEPKGFPTVSFRSARGTEASFCERKKR